MIKTTFDKRQKATPVNQLKIDVPHRLKAVVLFACAGICEYYLKDIGVDVVVANELEPDRAKLHHSIYPDCQMVIGDITTKEVQDKLIELINKEQCDILMMSPKCQQFTRANTHRDPDSDELLLFESGLQLLPHCQSLKYVMTENAKEFLIYTLNKRGGITAGKHIENELKRYGFPYVVKGHQNAKYFGGAMDRDRSIILAAKEKDINLPTPTTEKPLTLQDVIDDLPTLESRERGKYWYDVAGFIPDCQREQVAITPTGKRVQNPKTKAGDLSNAVHKGAFSRAEWDKPMHSVLTNNGDISAYHMIHPGRKIVDKKGNPILTKDGKEQFTDSRTFTIHEIFRALRLPDDIRIPDWAKPKTALIRTIIGECFCPLHCQAVIAEMVKAEFGIK